MWGGRFSASMDPLAWRLNASIDFDRRLGPQDVRGSLAWAKALLQAGILKADEYALLQEGLQSIAVEIESGSFAFQEGDEDIHSAVERRLEELIGPLAGKLHTGRSRNDQVATDLRLWLLDGLPGIEQALVGLQQALLGRAGADQGLIMPGYTHLQRAQPVLLSHWWLAHFWSLQRDRERLEDLSRRLEVLPLGSGALAGTAVPVDRGALAKELGFAKPAANSIDAVSDRDFVAEFLFCSALLGVHLSRLAEGVILFTSAEFGFFDLSDSYATGSSLMPQKKNPDIFELARGKAGSLIGMLGGLLSTLKGLPSAYDKDLQEDKLPLFQAYDILLALLPVLAGALRTLQVNPIRLHQAIDATMLATDLADLLVEKGIPFRQAHELVGKAVKRSEELGIALDSLSAEAWQSVDDRFGREVSWEEMQAVFDPQNSVNRRQAYGGTAPQRVSEQFRQARDLLIKPSKP